MQQTDKTLPGVEKSGTGELFQKRWFCVALYASGKTFKQDAESSVTFLEILPRSTVAWIDHATNDVYKDLPLLAAQLGFSETLISSLTIDNPLNYQDFDTEMWLRLPSIQIRQVDVTPYPLIMLIKKNFVFTIHSSTVDKRFIRLRRYADTVLGKIPPDANPQEKLTMVLTRIIDANNESNFRHLRVIEEHGDDLNEDLMNSHTPADKLGPKIYHVKHALITYMNALWDCMDVLQALRYGDAELVTSNPKQLKILNLMTDEIKGQIGLAENMSQVLASGLGAMQIIHNNQLQALNNRLVMVLTYFTIVGTAFLVPNTLATALSDPVWEIGPQDLWWYIIMMIVATFLATFGVWWWLRKKGWVPKKTE